jgi:translation initiation factor 3 subunit J
MPDRPLGDCQPSRGISKAEKKQAEQDRLDDLEIARRAMELELDAESNLTPDQLRALKQRKIEEADNELTNDLFGGVDNKGKSAAAGKTTQSGDKVVMKDIKDHLKHARAVASCLRGHGNVHYATAFFKELIQQSKDVLDDDAVGELVKSLNVMKNEKVQAMKRTVKGQAQKAKKDKTAEAKARKIQVDTFGDNDQFDDYDAMGGDYEDAFV